MSRATKPMGGRTFSQTCLIQGREVEGRKAVIKKGLDRTRIATIGPDGLTSDDSEKVPTSELHDFQQVVTPAASPSGPVAGIIGERGTITIPSDTRRRLRLQPGSPYLIEERDDVIVIQPATITPRRGDPGPTLDGLLAGVTADNIHGEVPTQSPVGGEA